MNKCQSCGAENAPDMKFCLKCGAAFGGVTAVPTKSKPPKLLIWASTAVVIVLIIVFAAMSLSLPRNTTTSSSNPTDTPNPAASSAVPDTQGQDLLLSNSENTDICFTNRTAAYMLFYELARENNDSSWMDIRSQFHDILLEWDELGEPFQPFFPTDGKNDRKLNENLLAGLSDPFFVLFADCYNAYYNFNLSEQPDKDTAKVRDDAIAFVLDFNEQHPGDPDLVPDDEWDLALNTLGLYVEKYKLLIESIDGGAPVIDPNPLPLETPSQTPSPDVSSQPSQTPMRSPANTLNYTFANGVSYDGKTYYGIMLDGKPDVYGVLFNEETGFFYIGGFKDGKYHTHGYKYNGAEINLGDAILKQANGQRYKVGFKDGLQHGPGWFYDSDDKVYESTWKDGKTIVDLSYYAFSDIIGFEYGEIKRSTDKNGNVTIELPLWYSGSGSKPSPPRIQISWNGDVKIATGERSGVYYQNSTGDWEYSGSAGAGSFAISDIGAINYRKGKLTDHRYDEKGNWKRDWEETENNGTSSESSGGSDYSPSFPSSSSSPEPNQKWVDCSSCSGKRGRDCLTCGGDGWVEVEYIGKIDGKRTYESVRCTNSQCSNGWIKCISCGGEGGKWVKE